MDYEKVYKELIEKLRKAKDDIDVCDDRYCVVIDDLVPELAESEDEKIRKELLKEVEYITPNENEYDDEGNTIPAYYKRLDKYRAWLEKQKENPQNADSIPSNCASDAKCEDKHNKPGDFVFKLRQIISRHWWADEHSDRIEDEEGMAKEILELCEKQKEQKHAEWGDGEKKVLDSIIDDYEKAAKSFCGYDGKIMFLKAIRDGEYNLPKPAEWSESVAKEMFIKALERAVEQTKKGYELTDCDKHSWWEDFKAYCGIAPAEWSEEDEKILNELLDHCNTENATWYNWLKSLRPQSHWKPNKEQMVALKDVVETYRVRHNASVGGDSTFMRIESLYRDLQKLL